MGRIAIIPARGGSKRIPRKNLRNFCGRPIIAYAIEAALKAGCFDEVMVSTDDEEIREVSLSLGASVPFLRSAELSTDMAPTAKVWVEVLDEYSRRGMECDIAASILPTAPFVTPEKLRVIMEKMESDETLDAIMPVVAYAPPIQRALRLRDGNLEMIWPEHRFARSQDLEPAYHDAGQYYAFRADSVRKYQSLRHGKLGAIVTSPLEVHDIDTEEDWVIAEMKYRLFQGKLHAGGNSVSV